jgi:hypothetical protein
MMEKSMPVTFVIMPVLAGERVKDVIKKAISFARDKSVSVVFDANGVNVMVEPDSVFDHVYFDWDRAYDEGIKFIGPKYAGPSLEKLKSDAVLEKFKARLAVAPEMSFTVGGKMWWDEWSEPRNWKKFKVDIREYVRSWARLMELEMDEAYEICRRGENVYEAKQYTNLAEYTFAMVAAAAGGISEFTKGEMISILKKCWQYSGLLPY